MPQRQRTPDERVAFLRGATFMTKELIHVMLQHGICTQHLRGVMEEALNNIYDTQLRKDI